MSFIISFLDRSVQHNISYSVFQNNTEGAFYYGSAGEISPTVTLEKNRFEDNCEAYYGNFTSCNSTIRFDVQNMLHIYFTVSFIKLINRSFILNLRFCIMCFRITLFDEIKEACIFSRTQVVQQLLLKDMFTITFLKGTKIGKSFMWKDVEVALIKRLFSIVISLQEMMQILMMLLY